MRVLMICQFYAPTIGGEEQHVRNLSKELAARGHQVAVATLWGDGLAEFELDGNVRVYRIRSTTQRANWLFSETERRHAPPFPDPQALLELRRVIRKERPDIVHAHNWLLHSFLPLKSWCKAGFIVTLHDYSFRCAKKRFMYQGAPCSGPGFSKCLRCSTDHYGPVKGTVTLFANWGMSVFERLAVDMFIAVSQATADGNGLPGSNLPFKVIPNFLIDDIDAEGDGLALTDPCLAQLPPGDFLLYAGDLSQDKGIEVLLQAYASLKDAPPLVLIGRKSPGTPAEFPAKVIHLGSWPHAAVMEAWRRSMLAIVPSLVSETFGFVAIEAMACGRPVVASRIGGLAEIILDEVTGILTPPGDVVALGEAIGRLIADPGLRERMGQAGKRRAVDYRASAVIPKIESVYQQVIDETWVTGTAEQRHLP